MSEEHTARSLNKIVDELSSIRLLLERVTSIPDLESDLTALKAENAELREIIQMLQGRARITITPFAKSFLADDELLTLYPDGKVGYRWSKILRQENADLHKRAEAAEAKGNAAIRTLEQIARLKSQKTLATAIAIAFLDESAQTGEGV